MHSHWFAISNARLIAHDKTRRHLRYKDYRADCLGQGQVMMLCPKPTLSFAELASGDTTLKTITD